MIKAHNFPPQYEKIVDLLRGYRAYLVGGAVRDALLNRPIHDLDFALPKDTIPAARLVADQLGGDFFILDSARDTCRIILNAETDQRLVVDFTLFQGKDIEEDLASRDFTITSMAIGLEEEDELVDLFHGARDLEEGLIRATSKSALKDDPVRCLRAVRLAAQLAFRILPETREQIQRNQRQLTEVSPERKRDELFRILAGPNQSAAVGSLQVLGLDSYVLPGEISAHRPGRLRNLETLWTLFLQEHDQERAASWSKGTLIHHLGRYRENIREFLDCEWVPGRSVYQLTFLMSLLIDLFNREGGLKSEQITDCIPLSNQEAAFLLQGIQSSQNWLGYPDGNQKDPALTVHRYFGEFGQAGLAGILISLGENLHEQREKKEQQSWITSLEQARFFLEGYWDRYAEWVDPPSLLDGNDIQQAFQIPPGPEIGTMLATLREEQVRGGLTHKKEALEFLRGHLPLSGRSSS